MNLKIVPSIAKRIRAVLISTAVTIIAGLPLSSVHAVSLEATVDAPAAMAPSSVVADVNQCQAVTPDKSCVAASAGLAGIELESGPLPLTSEDSSYVPGQLLLKMKPRVSLLGIQSRSADTLKTGDADMQKLHRRFGVKEMKLLFQSAKAVRNGISPLGRAQSKAAAPAASNMGSVYMLKLSESADAVAAAKAFSKHPEVEYAQPNFKIQSHFIPNDTYYQSTGSWGQPEDDLWGLKIMQMEAAWDISQGKGAIVAIVDTGVDYTHPEIVANIWRNPGEIADNGIDDDGNGYVDDTRGWDFGNDDNDPMDKYGHGTHVAGTVAAIGNNNIGVIGVAPQSTVMAVKGFADNGAGTIAALTKAILYAADNGAQVINNSWGCSGYCPSNPIAEDAVRIAHAKGALVIFSAGNSHRDVSNYSPQNMAETLTVAASQPSDAPASFSNLGLLDVTAPGGGDYSGPPSFAPHYNILSLKSQFCPNDVCFHADVAVGDGYLRVAGTSMSAPHVSGLAALVMSKNGNLTAEQTRQLIRVGSDDVGDAGFDLVAGYGRINATASLRHTNSLAALLTSPVYKTYQGETTADIQGLVYGTGLSEWALQYGVGVNPTTWTLVTTSSAQTGRNAELLYRWSIADVADGEYTLRLVAQDLSGESYEDRRFFTIDQVAIDSPAENYRAFYRSGEVVQISGTAASANMVSYKLVLTNSDGAVVSDANFNLANDGLQKVSHGLLGTWDTTGLPADHYVLALEVALANNETSSASAAVIVDPQYHPGWPIQLSDISGNQSRIYGNFDHLDMADVNLDGKQNVISIYGSDVFVLNENGKPLPGWPQTIDPDGILASNVMSPTVADIDGDGKPEVIASNYRYPLESQLFIWKSDGTLLDGWPKVVGGLVNSITIADVDANGWNDIVLTDYDGGVKVLDHKGSMLPGWPVTVGAAGTSRVLAPAAVDDLDGDGKLELVVLQTSAPTYLYVLSHDGVLQPGWPKTLNPSALYGTYASYPAIADLDDDDDDKEIVIGGDSQVHVYKHDGSYMPGWPQATKPTYVMSPSVGDINGDGKPDVVAGNAWVRENSKIEDYLFAWNADGTLMDGWPVRYDGRISYAWAGFAYPTLADVDGDGVADVISQSDFDGFSQPYSRPFALNAYKGDGSKVDGFPKPVHFGGGTRTNAAAVGDIDGDGLVEMAWLDGAMNLYVWDTPSPDNMKAKPWPMFGHDARHSSTTTRIKVEKTEMKGRIEEVTFTSIVVSGNTVHIVPLTRLKFEDGTGGGFKIGQSVELKGMQNPDGSILALKLEVSRAED